jgi:shikimate dehydrogenase
VLEMASLSNHATAGHSRDVLVGLIGSGIQSSRSPAMHMGEGAALGLRLVYKIIDLQALRLDVDALPSLVQSAEWMGFAGLNITHPCKQAVIPLLHELTPDAAAIGAVNTVLFREGRRIGANTDCWGFAESFRRGMTGAPLGTVVQLGAGGAGAAVAYALLSLGVRRLVLYDREAGRAEALAASMAAHFGPDRVTAVDGVEHVVPTADGLVNTTPMGMDKYPGLPLEAGLLRPSLWVAEIVYFPLETALLREARALGCRTLGGGGMALFQAVEAFRLFTDLDPDPDRMRIHFGAQQ